MVESAHHLRIHELAVPDKLLMQTVNAPQRLAVPVSAPQWLCHLSSLCTSNGPPAVRFRIYHAAKCKSQSCHSTISSLTCDSCRGRKLHVVQHHHEQYAKKKEAFGTSVVLEVSNVCVPSRAAKALVLLRVIGNLARSVSVQLSTLLAMSTSSKPTHKHLGLVVVLHQDHMYPSWRLLFQWSELCKSSPRISKTLVGIDIPIIVILLTF